MTYAGLRSVSSEDLTNSLSLSGTILDFLLGRLVSVADPSSVELVIAALESFMEDWIILRELIVDMTLTVSL